MEEKLANSDVKHKEAKPVSREDLMVYAKKYIEILKNKLRDMKHGVGQVRSQQKKSGTEMAWDKRTLFWIAQEEARIKSLEEFISAGEFLVKASDTEPIDLQEYMKTSFDTIFLRYK
jgi:hypothetical protein